MTNDRRRSVRLSWSGEMQISSNDDWRRVWPLDVSSHGAHFRGAHLPRPGTRLRVLIRVPCHLLRLAATVVWNDKPRAAVEFDPLTRDQQLALNTALLEAGTLAEQPTQRGGVLVMVDEPLTQLAIGRAVRSRGYRTIARTTPLDAIQTLAEPGPPLRVAIVSASLPHRAGEDMLDFLSQQCPRVRRALLVEPQWMERRVWRESVPDVVLSIPFHAEDIAPVFADLAYRAAN